MHKEKDSSKEPKKLRDKTTTHPTKVHQKIKKNVVLKTKREDLKKKTLS